MPRSLLDIDPELNIDFEEISPFQEGVISETYQKTGQVIFPGTMRIGKSDKYRQASTKVLTEAS